MKKDRKEIEQLVIKKIQKLTNKKVNSESTLEDLEIDSLSLVELVYDAEEELNIRIEDKKLMEIKNIQDIVNAIEEVLK